jgi:hypothetical protein
MIIVVVKRLSLLQITNDRTYILYNDCVQCIFFRNVKKYEHLGFLYSFIICTLSLCFTFCPLCRRRLISPTSVCLIPINFLAARPRTQLTRMVSCHLTNNWKVPNMGYTWEISNWIPWSKKSLRIMSNRGNPIIRRLFLLQGIQLVITIYITT